jgi:DNA-binding response OmpR family regulator
MPTVLIVEDEDLVREVALVEFEDAGFRVLEAADGEAAFAALDAETVDLLFTDIRLPGAIDGWHIARRARERHPGMPVIYASGFPGDAMDVVPGGRFVAKPYRPTTIVAMARELGAAASG